MPWSQLLVESLRSPLPSQPLRMVFIHAHVCGDRLLGQLEYFQLVRSKVHPLLKLPWSSAKPADYYSFFDPG